MRNLGKFGILDSAPASASCRSADFPVRSEPQTLTRSICYLGSATGRALLRAGKPALHLAIALICLLSVARADDIAEKGRAILAKNQHAVVTVQLVLKSKFSVPGAGGQTTESRSDATGTVIDPSGLTVLSLTATDPGTMIQNMMGGMGEEDMKFKMETELSDLKILLDDGTEIPAEVVLRDKDLDLAFIRPKSKLATPSS